MIAPPVPELTHAMGHEHDQHHYQPEEYFDEGSQMPSWARAALWIGVIVVLAAIVVRLGVREDRG